jgi:hypothetical protein
MIFVAVMDESGKGIKHRHRWQPAATTPHLSIFAKDDAKPPAQGIRLPLA